MEKYMQILWTSAGHLIPILSHERWNAIFCNSCFLALIILLLFQWNSEIHSDKSVNWNLFCCNMNSDHVPDFSKKKNDHRFCSAGSRGDLGIFTRGEGSPHFPFQYSKLFGFIRHGVLCASLSKIRPNQVLLSSRTKGTGARRLTHRL